MVDIPVRVIIDAIDNASKTLQGMGTKVSQMGTALIAIGSAPTAALVGATTAAIDFESSFAGVRKTVDMTEAEFEQLSNRFRDLAKTTPLSINDLNGIAEIAGSLGLSGVDNIAKFTETIAKIGITSNLTEQEAAMAFGRIINIMQEPTENVDRMGATIIDLGNKFAATERDITEFAERIAGAGKIAGLSTSDVFAIGTAMSSVGIEAEAGGTAVQKVLISMSQEATSASDEMGGFASAMGLTNDQFRAMFKQDPTAVFEGFVQKLGDVSASGGDAAGVLDDLGLSDQRLIRSFLSLSGAGDLLHDTINTGREAWKENAALQTEAEKRYATTASQIQIMKNRVYDLGITIGEAILPVLNDWLKKLQPIIENVSAFTKEHPKLTVVLLAAGAAMGLLGIALVGISAILPGLMVLIGAAAAVFAFIVSPIGLITVAVLAVIGIILLLKKAWESNWFDIQGKAEAAKVIIQNAIDGIIKFFQGLWDYILTLPEVFTQFVESLKTGIYVFFTETLPYAIGFFAGRLVKFVTEDVPAFIMGVIKWFQELPTKITTFVTQMAEAIQLWFTDSKDKAVDTTTNLVTSVLEWFGSLPDSIGEWLSKLPGIISQWFTDAKDKAVSIAKELYNGVKEWFGKVVDFFKDIVDWAGKAIGKAGEAASAGYNAGKRQFGGPVNSLQPVMVGEAGPEMFVPQTAGRIQPAHESGGGGGGNTIQFIINSPMIINSPSERRSIAEALYKDLVTLAKSQNITVAKMMGA